jgi:hypothetical protein
MSRLLTALLLRKRSLDSERNGNAPQCGISPRHNAALICFRPRTGYTFDVASLKSSQLYEEFRGSGE